MRISLILSASVCFLSSFVARSDAQQACNGYPELCSRTYNNVTFATAHNAFAYTPPGGVATNQDNDILTQMKDGIRAFMLDAYPTPSNNSKDIELCHTSCSLLDAGPLTKLLAQIKTFMDANPNEVITILWENAGNLKPAQFQTVYAAAGMDKYSYAQTVGNTTWPTLAEMISSGKRLVSFLDGGADATVPWLMAEYDFVFETPWDITQGSAYPCTVDRPKDQRKQMYVLNHFIYGQFQLGTTTVDIPQPGAANQTNGPDLTNHVASCLSTFKQIPSFIAVDFYEKGLLLQTVAQVNGVKWNNRLPSQPTIKGTGSGTGAGSGSGSGGGSANGASGLKRVGKRTLGVVAVAGGVAMMTL
ncbi:hypothetical protein BGZ99_008187 [Dissophora globulifera]|uniref:PLC-like phosphodiesterase n=1 Tax=Dissophora globulifera TaxID=979702 RepID=A0A9P6RVI4_9FUNG|nr:hypothetical protein BGZ99_008187 [Dissophora globulifera]